MRRVRDDESFRGLKVWQQSMTLVEEIYRVTRAFPSDERFGLTSQIRRASVSIPSTSAKESGENDSRYS
jgi:four helix bundle protein